MNLWGIFRCFYYPSTIAALRTSRHSKEEEVEAEEASGVVAEAVEAAMEIVTQKSVYSFRSRNVLYNTRISYITPGIIPSLS